VIRQSFARSLIRTAASVPLQGEDELALATMNAGGRLVRAGGYIIHHTLPDAGPDFWSRATSTPG
jgi:hypothetical protein